MQIEPTPLALRGCRRPARVRRRPRLAAALFAIACLLLTGTTRWEGPPIYPDARSTKPLVVGDALPALPVESLDGDAVDLASLVRESGALLVFYRGGWCPYCSTQLGELRRIEDELAGLGFPILAVSPDRPEKLRASRKKAGLGYRLFSDRRLEAARRMGIVFQLTPPEVEGLKKHGIDIEEASGETHHRLPVPSVFLVEKGGRILWVYSNPDYRVRPENDALLQAAREAVGRAD